MEPIEILFDLAKASPVIGILVYMHWKNGKTIDKKEEDIAELNRQLRESEKTSLEAFSRATEILKSLSQEQTSLSKDIINELKSLREWLGFHMKKHE